MKLQTTLDKSAIGVSFLCLVHCLLLPAFIVLLPTVFATFLENELFHKVLVFCVIPLSIIALFMGCQKHKVWGILMLGFVGLVVLLFAAFFGDMLFGEAGEKIGTLTGSLFIIISHYKNYRLCSKHSECEC